jgi:hypothetical protein
VSPVPGGLTSGAWLYTFGRRNAACFVAFLQMLLAAYPSAPAVAVICDNDSIHHAKVVATQVLRAELQASRLAHP